MFDYLGYLDKNIPSIKEKMEKRISELAKIEIAKYVKQKGLLQHPGIDLDDLRCVCNNGLVSAISADNTAKCQSCCAKDFRNLPEKKNKYMAVKIVLGKKQAKTYPFPSVADFLKWARINDYPLVPEGDGFYVSDGTNKYYLERIELNGKRI